MRFPLIIFLVLAIPTALAFPNSISFNIQVTEAGEIETGTYDFNVSISNETDCSNPIYSDLQTLTTDDRGIVNLVVETNVDFSEYDYRLCYYRNAVLKMNRSLSATPYAFYAQNTSWAGVINKPTSLSDFINDIGVNSTFNQTLTDTLYADIKWGYNMTTPFTNWLATFVYNYNQTIPANTYTDAQDIIFNNSITAYVDAQDHSGGNLSWNQTHAEEMFIELDGSTTTTAVISLDQGVYVPEDEPIMIGDSGGDEGLLMWDSAENRLELTISEDANTYFKAGGNTMFESLTMSGSNPLQFNSASNSIKGDANGLDYTAPTHNFVAMAEATEAIKLWEEAGGVEFLVGDADSGMMHLLDSKVEITTTGLGIAVTPSYPLHVVGETYLGGFTRNTGGLNSTGLICDSTGCIGSGGGSDGTGGWVNNSYETNTSLNVNANANLSVGDGLFVENVNPDASSNINFFQNTDVGDDEDGKSLSVWRKAAEGDIEATWRIDRWKNVEMDAIGATRAEFFPNVLSMELMGNAGGDVKFFHSSGSGENRDIQQSGYITSAGTRRYINWVVEDSDDYFHLGRETTDILGFKVDMPLVIENNLTVGNIKLIGEESGNVLSRQNMYNDTIGIIVYNDSVGMRMVIGDISTYV